MEKPLPAIGRTTFIVHTIVAVAVGLPMLAAPLAFEGLFAATFAARPR